jgi:hypothetical protein
MAGWRGGGLTFSPCLVPVAELRATGAVLTYSLPLFLITEISTKGGVGLP